MWSSWRASGALDRPCLPRRWRGFVLLLLSSPAGFGIDDPEDWIEFITFIVTAVVAGELASRASGARRRPTRGASRSNGSIRSCRQRFDRASEVEAARRNEQLKAVSSSADGTTPDAVDLDKAASQR